MCIHRFNSKLILTFKRIEPSLKIILANENNPRLKLNCSSVLDFDSAMETPRAKVYRANSWRCGRYPLILIISYFYILIRIILQREQITRLSLSFYDLILISTTDQNFFKKNLRVGGWFDRQVKSDPRWPKWLPWNFFKKFFCRRDLAKCGRM